MSENEDSKPFDRFELATALLLGLTAIGAAVSGLQANQWGGQQLDAFSASNALMTKASSQYNEDTVAVNADYAAVAAAKIHILEARDASDSRAHERHMDIASYLYESQMSELGYKAMGLPMDYFVEDEDADAAEPAAADAAEEEPEEVDPATALERDLPDDVLIATLTQELDEEYLDKALETGSKMFDEADAKFALGRTANENGDRFELAGVYFTVALFFAGLGLVFKSRVRWVLLALGSTVFVGTALYLTTVPWP